MNDSAPPLTFLVETAQRLDKGLSDVCPDISRSRLKTLILEGQVQINGTPCANPSHKVKPGDQLQLSVPEATPLDLTPQEIPLEIYFEDEHLLILNKPAGLVVHPAPGNEEHTLVHALLAHCGEALSGINGVLRPGIVHRLDKLTSGVMVVAKTDQAHQHLSQQFQDHSLERAYYALVWGHPSPKAGRIDQPLGRHPTNRKKIAVLPAAKGKHALTNYETLEQHRFTTLMRAQLETGRTHQIRVHMQHLGHSLVGDPLYGRAPKLALQKQDPSQDAEIATLKAFPRQALHAYVIGITHPKSGEFLRFEAPVPDDFAQLLSVVRRC